MAISERLLLKTWCRSWSVSAIFSCLTVGYIEWDPSCGDERVDY